MSRTSTKPTNSSTEDFQQYLTQANTNFEFADLVRKDKNISKKYKGWVPVIYFYSVRHYLSALLVLSSTNNPHNHETKVNKTGEVEIGSNDLAVKYLKPHDQKYLALYVFAVNARYIPKFFTKYCNDEKELEIAREYAQEIKTFVQNKFKKYRS